MGIHCFTLTDGLTRNLWMPPTRRACTHQPSLNASRHLTLSGIICPSHCITPKHVCWTSAGSIAFEEESGPSSEEQLGERTEAAYTQEFVENISQLPSAAELKSLLADAERSKLMRKLTEANQYNRFLKRQMQIEDNALANFKGELAVMVLELQALVGLAAEIADSDIPLGTRKINGMYIQSHLLSRLKALHEKVLEQIKDVESLKSRELKLHWIGMAESVKVMGSFDGWTEGEEMSREYSGDYARFSATLKLRPGRYEIKFLVDGDWQLSPEFPVVGDGMLKNNLLFVGELAGQ